MNTKYNDIFKDDKLNIQSNVIDFAHLIEQDISTSKVYSLSADFGIGKTFFCNHLMQVLKKDKVRVVKLNIWEMDFYDNPLMPILSELNELYKKNGKSLPIKILNYGKNIFKKAYNVAVECGANVATACLAEKIAEGTGTVIKPEDIKLLDNIEKQFKDEDLYHEYQEYKEALIDLKNCLGKWATKKDTPIVMIIDELDRCRPDYAVQTLETLKHFFDIPGFVFVLAIDDNQLENSVKTLFGTTNFDGYKRKFINNTFLLPEPDRKAFATFLYDNSKINNVIKQIQDDKRELTFHIDIYNVYVCTHQYHYGHNHNTTDQGAAREFNSRQTSEQIIKRYFATYSEWFKFDLRQMAQVFDRLVLFIRQIANSNQLFSPDLAVLLICLHEFDNQIYTLLCKELNPIEGSVIEKIFAGMDSYAYQLYKDEANKKFGTFLGKVAPRIPMQETFSSKIGFSKQEIIHNVDRFFISQPLDWLLERDALSTNGVLTEQTNFDLKKFKKDYFKRMDFISHFE